jgi:hypothetical protein
VRWGGRRSIVSVAISTLVRREEEIARRTFGGMPLITGINRIYKNRAMVERPDRAETPTNGLKLVRLGRE